MSAAPLQPVKLARDDDAPTSLLDAFHRINNVLPEDHYLQCVDAHATVQEALTLLKENNFSQAPVRAGEYVIGMFSYRSFGQRAAGHCAENVDIGALSVDDFMEPIAGYASINDDLPKTFDVLDRDNALVVGTEDNPLGILTPVDVLRYLYDAASPYVMIAEIEQTLRRIIVSCCSAEELSASVSNALAKAYKGDPPSALEDMTFNDYVQLIGDGRNWAHFAPAFGANNDYQRKQTRRTLEEIRDLRNDIFHFKRAITEEDRLTLATHRTWLWGKALRVRAQQRQTNA